MHIVAAKAGDTMRVHDARDKVIALHAIFVRRSVREVRKGRFAQLVVFQFPEIFKVQADAETDRPIVVFVFDGTCQGLSLGMALNADVIRLDIVQAGRVYNV
jgi:hypothetical protein